MYKFASNTEQILDPHHEKLEAAFSKGEQQRR